MKRICLNAIVWALLVSALLMSGCEQPSRATAGDVAPNAALPDAALKDLQSLEELQKLFNQDKGSPRLILLLSPT